MHEATQITFKPVMVDDLPLLENWMRSPHWKEWWGEAENELADICNMIEGKDTTRPFIFSVEGEPAGYIQYWHVGHVQNPSWVSRYPWLADLPRDALGVDISIGEAEKLSKGFGTAALRQFVNHLQALGYKTILIDPDPENNRAIRAYEKAGFVRIEAFNKNATDCIIMQYLPEKLTTESSFHE